MQKIMLLIILGILLSTHAFAGGKKPCNLKLELALQISNPFHRISSDLNILASAYAVNGVDSTSLNLTTSFNNGLIIPEAQYFSDAITSVGVKPEAALRSTEQIIQYALALENYAIAFNSHGNVKAAQKALDVQLEELIASLAALPHVKLVKVRSFMNQYQQHEIASLQAFAGDDFSLGVAEHEQAQTVIDNMAAYLAKQLLT